MNCYYSNLIEGHDTHPVHIERAFKNGYSQGRCTRDLQHLKPERTSTFSNGLTRAASKTRAPSRARQSGKFTGGFATFCPRNLLSVVDPATKERARLIRREFRKRDVWVGDHIAISPASPLRFLAPFEQVHGALGKADWIISAAVAHHRLLWTHPFIDRNGRGARLMAHARFLTSSIPERFGR